MIYKNIYINYFFRFIIILVLFLSSISFAATLNAVKINSLGTYAAGSAIPTWLAGANAVGQFAGRFNPYIIVGTTILASALSDYQSPPNQLNLLPRFQTGINTPEGWNNPNSPIATAPLQTLYSPSFGPGVGTWFQSGALACASLTVSGICNPPWSYTAPSTCSHSNPVCTSYLQINNSCPSGYKTSGSSCILDEPTSGYAKWPVDGIPSVYPNPTTAKWTEHPRDPDNAISPALGAGSDTISRSGNDPVGNPVNETSKVNADGSTTITRDHQGQDSTGSSAVQRDSYTYNQAGNVTNVSSQTFANSTITNINTSTSPPIDVSALAKDETLQSTNTKLEQIKDKLTKDESALPGLPQVRSIPDSLSLVFNAIKTKFTPPTFQDSSGSCPIWQTTIPYFNIPFVVDQLCIWEPNLRPIISGVMFAVWAIMAVKILLSA